MSRTSVIPALDLLDITVVRDGRIILNGVSLRVEPEQRWLVLGPNGSGKTTLVRIAALHDHPTRGAVRVMGETLGETDVRTLRRRIGWVSASFAEQLRPALQCLDVVMTAKNAALEPWWHQYDAEDRRRARRCLDARGVGDLADRPFGSLSSGEQQRVLLARSLMNEPGVLILDEPSARLDLGGREQLVAALTELVEGASSPPLVLVTHHLDEVPPGMTHVILLRDGSVLRSGPITTTLDDDALSECFGLRLRIVRRPDGRLSAWSVR